MATTNTITYQDLIDNLQAQITDLVSVKDSLDPEGTNQTTFVLRGRTYSAREDFAFTLLSNEIDRLLANIVQLQADQNSGTVSAEENPNAFDYFTPTTTPDVTDATETVSAYLGRESSYDAPITDHNVPPVKDSFFGQTVRLLGQDRRFAGNQPASIEKAIDLFSSTQYNKGMIVTHYPTSFGDDTAEASLYKYAFLFHYNPTVVSMSLSNNTSIDPLLYAQQPPSVSPAFGNYGGGISFSLMLNRIADMQYYDNTGRLQIKGEFASETDAKSLYGGKYPTAVEQQRIWNYGTMYDIEWLLKTVTGVEYDTLWRGKTADIGFLTGKLCELHLGNRLRYLVFIDSINIEHLIFDERMVPMLTNVSITVGRIPDFKVASTDTATDSTVVPV